MLESGFEMIEPDDEPKFVEDSPDTCAPAYSSPRYISLTKDQARWAAGAYQVMTAMMQLEKCVASVLQLRHIEGLPTDFTTDGILRNLNLTRNKLAGLHTFHLEQITLTTVSNLRLGEVTTYVRDAVNILTQMDSRVNRTLYQTRWTTPHGSRICAVVGTLACAAWLLPIVSGKHDCHIRISQRFAIAAYLTNAFGFSIAYDSLSRIEKHDELNQCVKPLLTTLKLDLDAVRTTIFNISAN